ncbi:MAG: serine hydrolase [Bacilli bacterium]|nr:serine hydrolase [Bacilli bacterium]
MNYNITTDINNIKNNKVKEKINNLINIYLKESEKGRKVAFYYENTNTNNIISYNKDLLFYAASSIKVLICLMILELSEQNKINIEDKLLVTMDDIKRGTGIIKEQTKDTYYTIKKLIELTITESDNTAYIKLVNLIGKDKLKEYGLNLGAKHSMEGKETDSFGAINCTDMIIYWKKIKKYIDSNKKYSKDFKEYLQNTTTKLIDSKYIDNKPFMRKYGSFDVYYHEAGYIEDNNDSYFLIILTRLNQYKYKESFFNKTAKKINEINKLLN